MELQGIVTLNDFAVTFSAMLGVGGFISFLVNVLKVVRVVKDGNAQEVINWFNVAAFVGLFIIANYAPEVDLGYIDSVAQTIADAGWLILGVLVPGGIATGTFVYSKTRGLPLVGFSHSQPQ